MKIIVFSDSHGDVDAMYSVVIAENPDTAVHLGDHINDGLELQAIFPGLPVRLVRGNTDYISGPDEINFELAGYKIYATHGHLFNVKSGMTDIYRKGAGSAASVVLFGHTHSPFINRRDGVWYINPGSIGHKRGPGNQPSYGILTAAGGGLRCEIVSLPIK